MLYDFQKDAVLAIINILEKYNGCILADSVGLGKTFTALAVIKYYENKNKSVLVLCPKKLAENWNKYKDNYVNNPIAWIGYKAAAQSGNNAFKVSRYYHTDWLPEEELPVKLESLGIDNVYENFLRQITRDNLRSTDIKEAVGRNSEI